MCGRYHFELGTSIKSKSIIEQINNQELDNFKLGEIFPKDNCLVLIQKDPGVELKVVKWGIEKNALLINARNETINQKPSFRNLKRCAVIASGFYEWKDKNKYYFKGEEEYIYLASLYDEYNQMVIITKQADDSMHNIHERMPIIMNQKEMLEYLRLNKKDINKKVLEITNTSKQTKLF